MSKNFGINMDIPEVKGDRKLVWGDCFNGNDIDKEIWTPVAWNVADIHQEWSDKTYYVKDGQVVLFSSKVAPEEVVDGKPYYTPCFLTTKDRMEFKYGYFEIKAQIPFYKGNSGAYWFCSTEKTKDGSGAEFDMVEQLGSETNVVANLHQWNPHASNDGTVPRAERSHTFESAPEVLRTETHTYFMEWTPDYVDFGVDGEVYFHAPLTPGSEHLWNKEVNLDTFRLPIYFIMSEYLYTPARKLGCSMDGTEEPFKWVMKVDHVALYQKDGEEIYFK
ncbi:MAG: family 16 glycosylhydrolase [Clostridia bacterium]|nr:family 16 glycosylhydrolase [Clostridia bacterium]